MADRVVLDKVHLYNEISNVKNYDIGKVLNLRLNVTDYP